MNSVAELVAHRTAVIFDLFHTLIAVELSAGRALPSTSEVLGLPRDAWNEQIYDKSRSRLVGEETDPIAIIGGMAHAIDPAIPHETIQEAVAMRIKRFGAGMIDVPQETIDALQALKDAGKKIGLISNADVMEIAEWPQSPIASAFDSTVFSCYAGAAKPEPAIYEKSLDDLGISAGEAVFVGDGSCSEHAGARAVGLTTVMITGKLQGMSVDKLEERKQHADFVIEELEELLPSE